MFHRCHVQGFKLKNDGRSMNIQFKSGICVAHIAFFCFQIALVTTFEIRLGTQQYEKLFPKGNCISSNVRQQIIAGAKLS